MHSKSTLWHCGGCLNKRARRCAARSSTRRKQNNGIKNKTQSRAERAFAAKPFSNPLVFPVRNL